MLRKGGSEKVVLTIWIECEYNCADECNGSSCNRTLNEIRVSNGVLHTGEQLGLCFESRSFNNDGLVFSHDVLLSERDGCHYSVNFFRDEKRKPHI